MYEPEVFLRRARVLSRSKILVFLVVAHNLPLPILLFVTLDIVILGCYEKCDAATCDANDDLVSPVI